MSDLLFSKFQLGRITLTNRVVMAPMTRSRAIGNIPSELAITYYGQRADAGLLITEGTSPSPDGLGYARIPGIFNDAQQAAWKRVTDEVHARGSRIFVQLMHTGRVGHENNLPKGARVVGPSAIAAPGTMHTDQAGAQPHPVPHAMTEADIEKALGEFTSAAQRAIAAGFDGIELHGANGYLIEQFLNAASNQRTDGWGGSIEGRIRFAVEAAKRAAAAIGGDRVAIRVSPAAGTQGLVMDAQTTPLYLALMQALKPLGLAYVHVVDHSAMGAPKPPAELLAGMRETFGGPFILAGNFDAHRAEAALSEKRGELIAFGRPFIANPSLVKKLKSGAQLRGPDFATFYTPGAAGYTDYPVD